MGIIIGILWFLVVVVMLLLFAVILLQEGKGGGLAEAFGGIGAETFGVKATGINRFTAILGGTFLLLAVLINLAIRHDRRQIVGPDLAPPVVESLQLPAGTDSPAPDAGGEER